MEQHRGGQLKDSPGLLGVEKWEIPENEGKGRKDSKDVSVRLGCYNK